MKAFLAGLVVAVGVAALAAIASNSLDLRSSDIYQSHNGSVRL